MKKIIALIGAFAMVASMSVAANAEILSKGLSATYDVANSTSTEAKVKVYLTGYSGDITQVFFQLPAPATVVDYTKLTAATKGDYIVSKISGANATVNPVSAQGFVVFTASATGGITTGEGGLLAEITLPLLPNAPKTSLTPLQGRVQVDGTTYKFTSTTTGAGTLVSGEVAGEYILPQSATVATGTTISTDTASAPATYFSVEATAVSGATPYWYANIDGTAMKTKQSVPNVSGNTTLGLIFEGTETISDVKLVWE